MRKLNSATADAVIAVIEQGYADGFRHIGLAHVTAYGVLGMIGWTHRWFRPEASEFSTRAIGEIHADMIVSGLA